MTVSFFRARLTLSTKQTRLDWGRAGKNRCHVVCMNSNFAQELPEQVPGVIASLVLFTEIAPIESADIMCTMQERLKFIREKCEDGEFPAKNKATK